jgi:4-amino-4-deoxychorismate lyase
MSLLFESIKLVDGCPKNLDFHFARIFSSRKSLGLNPSVRDFEQFFTNLKIPPQSLFKLRIDYDSIISDHKITPYSLPNYKFLNLFYSDCFDYSLKYTDRTAFNDIEKNLNPNSTAAIIIANRFTDALFANLLFFDGCDFFTPNKPLLQGTKRAFYLAENRIKTRDLKIEDLKFFLSINLINSMIDIEDNIFFPIQNIIF